MIDRDSPVTEDELHAYVDGELPPDRTAAVSTWLTTHPEQAALVAGWRAQADSIRAHYGAIAAEPVPSTLKLDTVKRLVRASGRGWIGMAAAASLAAFLIGGGTGWVARGVDAGAADRVRTAHRRCAAGLQALRRRGAASGRSAGRRSRAHDAVAVEAARLFAEHSQSGIDRPEARRRPPAAGADRRSRRLLHV